MAHQPSALWEQPVEQEVASGTSTETRSQFVPISLRVIRLASVTPFDLYVRIRDEFVLYRHAPCHLRMKPRRRSSNTGRTRCM